MPGWINPGRPFTKTSSAQHSEGGNINTKQSYPGPSNRSQEPKSRKVKQPSSKPKRKRTKYKFKQP